MKKLPMVPAEKLIDTQIDNAISVISSITDLSKGDAIGMGLRLFKNLVSGNFFQGLISEWERLKRKGAISNDYVLKAENLETLGEILDYLETTNPKDEILNVLKKLFLLQITKEELVNEITHREFMSTTKTLEPNDILMLMFLYENFSTTDLINKHNAKSVNDFFNYVITHSGFTHNYFVRKAVDNLAENNLIVKIEFHSLHSKGPIFTSYGLAFCEYLNEYDSLKEDPA